MGLRLGGGWKTGKEEPERNIHLGSVTNWWVGWGEGVSDDLQVFYLG